MAKRYNEQEKRNFLASYLESGQSYAAYSRVCGISAITLKSWQQQYGQSAAGGFEVITEPLMGSEFGFRLRIGAGVIDFDKLPPVDWVCELLKRMSN